MKRRSGFTRVDLAALLFLALLAIGVLSSSLALAQGTAKRTVEMEMLKEFATAALTAESDMRRLPPAWGPYGRPRPGTTSKANANVFVHLLPYLQQKPLFDTGKFEKVDLPMFNMKADPSRPKDFGGHTSFVANLRVFSTWGSAKMPNEAIADLANCKGGHFSSETLPDGAATTIYFATKYASCNGVSNLFYLAPGPNADGKGAPFFGAGNHDGAQTPTKEIATGNVSKLPAYQIAPAVNGKDASACNSDAGVFGHSFTAQGMPIALGDRSVRLLSLKVSGTTYSRLLSPGDGAAVGTDW